LFYLENAFSGVQCPSVVLGLRKSVFPLSLGCKVERGEIAYVIKKKRELPDASFGLNMTDDEYLCLNKICNSLENAVKLRGSADFALGIVTGDNGKYVRRDAKEGRELVLKGSDIQKYSYAPPRNYIKFAPELFQQAAPSAYYRAPGKLLYRFICDSLVFAYDDSGMLSLNSCNIVIPKIEGLHIKYILAILNSRAAQFFCDKSFNSVKLLKSHIEQIPIPLADVKIQKMFVSKVDRILKRESGIMDLYNDIDKDVMDLFKLSSRERKIITDAVSGKNIFLPGE
jgi:hypothetical protein